MTSSRKTQSSTYSTDTPRPLPRQAIALASKPTPATSHPPFNQRIGRTHRLKLRTHRTPSRIKELVTAATRGTLRDSAVSLLSPTLLSPTQDHINDLRPPGERYKQRPTLTDCDESRTRDVTRNARTLTERDVSHRGGPVEG